MTKNTICCVQDCGAPAAFITNKRPTFCREHVAAIFRAAGLELLEPFEKVNDYYLTCCFICGEELHYRFKYLLDAAGYPTGERACRVCYWRDWYFEGDIIGAVNSHPITKDEAENKAVAMGADLIKIIPGRACGQELYVTRCRGCGLLAVEREPYNHEKCRPLKASMAKPVNAPSSLVAIPEKTYPVTENQRISAREFQPDNYLAFLRDRSWWDFSANDNAQLFSLTPSSRTPVHALCRECGTSFESPVLDLFATGTTRYIGTCSDCRRHYREECESVWNRYETTVIADYPELLACWDDDGNPFSTVVSNHCLRKWKCPKNHHPRQTPISFIENGCMVCSSQASKERNARDAKHTRIPHIVPPELCDQWHPTKNVMYEYGKTHISAKRKVWWKCDHCGFEWEESVRDRTRVQWAGAWEAWHTPYCRCPECGGTLDSLAWHYPSLAAEWSAANPESAWGVRPNSTTLGFVPQWVCVQGHTWSMSLTPRVHGAGCPECQEVGKSKMELFYYETACKLWQHAAVKSGAILRHESFSCPWVVDILVVTTRPFVIEYDGAYWHTDRSEIDARKSRELISAGYVVIRIREKGLPLLGIDDPSYHEIEVLPTGADCDAVLAKVSSFMDMKNTF